MDYRFATFSDIPLLVEANSQWIVDEGLPSRLKPSELEKRFWDWLGEDYRAVLFEDEGVRVGYALYRPDSDHHVQLRHFYIRRDLADKNAAAAEALNLLHEEIWAPGTRVRVEIQADNPSSLAFWRSMGFREQVVTLEWDGESVQAKAAS